MIALKSKNRTEVVCIVYEKLNLQRCATATINKIKEHISNKENKASKSRILVRWMITKSEENKENITLCAHWYNNGTLPRFTKSWPGEKFLCKNEALDFSEQLQKWFYQKKSPIWQKTKSPPSKIMQEVKRCNLQNCEVCDEFFPAWKSVADAVANNLASEGKGLVVFSAVADENREIVQIASGKHRIRVDIKTTVEQFYFDKCYDVRAAKFKNKNTRYEVRWISPPDSRSDEMCFLYAHWFNADKRPVFNSSHMPGGNILSKNKNFVQRIPDNKWLYQIKVLKETKFSKAKEKKRIRNMANEYLEYG